VIAGAPCHHSAPGLRRPRSRADPQASTSRSPAYSIPPRTASLATAPLTSRIARNSPQHPVPERRLAVSWDSTRRGGCVWLLAATSQDLPARSRALKPGNMGPQTASTAMWGKRAIFRRPGTQQLSPGAQDCLEVLGYECGEPGEDWDDCQRTKQVMGSSNGESGFCRLNRARPSAPGKIEHPLSLDRGGP
jgi:hypothetical protein